MTQKNGNRPDPEDVWGLEVLDPEAQYKWAEMMWHNILAEPDPKSLLLRYAPSAERAVLRMLRAFTRFGRLEHSEIFYFAPQGTLLLPDMPDDDSRVFLVHRVSRFLNLKEWLTRRGRMQGNYFIFTAPVDERVHLPAEYGTLEAGIPKPDSAVENHRAREILRKFFKNRVETEPEFRAFVHLMAEVGIAGIEISIELVMKTLGQSSDRVFAHLCRPEICDLIRISQSGPLLGRVISFRGAWLAHHIAANAKSDRYPLLQDVLDHIDPDDAGDGRFVLSFLTALRAQNCSETLSRIRREWHEKITACRQASKAADKLAWFLFFHGGWLNGARIFFYLAEQKIRHLLRKRFVSRF